MSNTDSLGRRVWNKTKQIASDVGARVLDNIETPAYEDGRQFQRDLDIDSAIRAFIELRQSNETIMVLLAKYFGVKDISDAHKRIEDTRACVQYDKLRDYCMSLGMTSREFYDYADEHYLDEKLDSNPKLLELSPEKLKAAIEKD